MFHKLSKKILEPLDFSAQGPGISLDGTWWWMCVLPGCRFSCTLWKYATQQYLLQLCMWRKIMLDLGLVVSFYLRNNLGLSLIN